MIAVPPAVCLMVGTLKEGPVFTYMRGRLRALLSTLASSDLGKVI